MASDDYKKVTASGEPFDQFMEDMGKLIENTGNDVKRMTTQLSEV